MASSSVALLVALAAALVSSGALGQVYKCQDAQGKTSYQQKPCESPAAKSSVIAAPAARPLASTEGRAAYVDPAPPERLDMPMRRLMIAKEACDRYSPGFEAETREDFARWRTRNEALIRAAEADPDYLKWRAAERQHRDAMFKRAGECERWRALIARAGAAPDPGRSTPEQAWWTFAAAVNAGNLDAVQRSSVGIVDVAKQGDFEKALPKMREWVKESARIEIDNTAVPTPKGLGERSDGSTVEVTFVRHDPNWYVSRVLVRKAR